jgi:hypothetical protein
MVSQAPRFQSATAFPATPDLAAAKFVMHSSKVGVMMTSLVPPYSLHAAY